MEENVAEESREVNGNSEGEMELLSTMMMKKLKMGNKNQEKGISNLDYLLGDEETLDDKELLESSKASRQKLFRVGGIRKKSDINRQSLVISLTESGSQKVSAPRDQPLSEQLKEKIVFAISNSLITKVQGLNYSTVDSYLKIIKDTFYLDESPAWGQISGDIEKLVSTGHKLHISGLKVTMDRLKRKSVKLHISFPSNPHHKYVTKEKECIDGSIKFDDEFFLLTPGTSNPTLRIQIIRIKKASNSEEKIVAQADFKLNEVSSFKSEMKKQLMEFASEWKPKKLSLGSSELHSSSLQMTGYVDTSEPPPSETAVKIITSYLLDKADKQLNLQLGDLKKASTAPSSPVRYVCRVRRSQHSTHRESAKDWWRFGGDSDDEDDDHTKERHEDGEADLNCILTNYLEVGSRSNGRTTSPVHFKKLPSSNKTSPSPSLRQSMSSLLSLPQLTDLRSNSTKYWGMDFLHFVPAEKRHDKGGSWESNLVVYANTCKKLLPDELKLMYSRAILSEKAVEGGSYRDSIQLPDEESSNGHTMEEADDEAVEDDLPQVKQKRQWTGRPNRFVLSILRVLEAFTDSSTESTEVTVAKGWVRAHNQMPLQGGLIQPQIDVLLASSAWDRSDPDLHKFEENALNSVSLAFHPNDRSSEVKTSLGLLHQVDGNIQNEDDEDNEDETIAKKVESTLRRCVKSIFKELTGKETVFLGPGIFAAVIKVLNATAYAHLKLEAEKYEDAFREFAVDYKSVVASEFMFQAIPLLKKYIDTDECRVLRERCLSRLFQYDESKLETNHLLQAFSAYRALSRVAQYCDKEKLVVDLFQDYSPLLMKLAIKKAEVQVGKLVDVMVKEERDAHDGSTHHNGNHHAVKLGRSDSYTDAVQEQLVTFIGISDTCWNFWEELGWSSSEDKLESGLDLIDGLHSLEAKLLSQKEEIYLSDCFLNSDELVKTIRFLDGLKDRYRKNVDQIMKLHNSQQFEKEDVYCEQVSKAYMKLEEMRDLLDNEVQNKITTYVAFQKNYIYQMIRCKEKNLLIRTSEGDSLLDFLDKEINNLLELSEKNLNHFSRDAVTKLWEAMETELNIFFMEKKERNKKKNKPERFAFLREGLSVIIECKRDMIEQKLSHDLDFVLLDTIKREVELLTLSSQDLICLMLRRKEDIEEWCQDDTYHDPVLTYKIALMREESPQAKVSVLLEVSHVKQLRFREGKDSMTVLFGACLYPPPAKQPAFRHVWSPTDVSKEKAVIFDMGNTNPMSWEFSLDHLLVDGEEQYQENKDAFLCVDLFDKGLIKKYFCGDIVIQVMKNGHLLSEIPEVKSREDLKLDDRTRSKSMQSEDLIVNHHQRELFDRRDDLAHQFKKWHDTKN